PSSRAQQPSSPGQESAPQGTWRFTGSMQTARSIHTATLLRDGNVLVTGGYAGSCTGLASSELYNPNSETWSPTGSLANARYYHTATLLRDGKVLVVGGIDACGSTVYASAELYDPASGTWS